MRSIRTRYADPLDIIWLTTCERWGWKVERSDQVFASWDGDRTLTIGTSETLDADDSLAQLILHEFCHAMVEGESAWTQPDWGLDITDSSQLIHEHAALVLQAMLGDLVGLRSFFGSTTDARRFYDRLPASAEELRRTVQHSLPDESTAFAMAKAGFQRATSAPFHDPLMEALQATQTIAELLQPFVDDSSLWAADSERSQAGSGGLIGSSTTTSQARGPS